eukprot:15430624-Alexandrium_andersonii.AAC.1
MHARPRRLTRAHACTDAHARALAWMHRHTDAQTDRLTAADVHGRTRTQADARKHALMGTDAHGRAQTHTDAHREHRT